MSIAFDRVRRLRVVAWSLLGLASFAGSSPAEDDPEWLGKRVITRLGAPGLIGRRGPIAQKLEYTAGGTQRRTARVYRVERIDGPWARLEQVNGTDAGWIESKWLCRSDKAVDYYTQEIYKWPYNRAAYMGRALIWMDRTEYDNAIADNVQAIRLFQASEVGWANLGNAFRAKGDYAEAIVNYDEAIRQKSDYVDAWYNRSVTRMIQHRPESIAGFRKVLDLERGKGEYSPYALILGTLGSRRAGDEATARAFLDRSPALDPASWPFPVVRWLKGEIDEAKLLALAADDNKRTEVRCFLGLDQLIKDRKDEARAHFAWARYDGIPANTQYCLALAELDRLGEAAGSRK